MNNEISKEDLFRKIDKLKIRMFDIEDALKSAEIRIQELNKCNDYANEELEKYKNIIDELEKWLNETQINSPFIDEGTIMEVRSKLKELRGFENE